MMLSICVLGYTMSNCGTLRSKVENTFTCPKYFLRRFTVTFWRNQLAWIENTNMLLNK